MDVILTIIGSVLIILLGIVGFFLRKTLDDLEERIKQVESEQKWQRMDHENDMNSMKMNYLDRFDKMKDHQHKVKEEIINAINELKNEFREQKQFCFIMQKNKKENKK